MSLFAEYTASPVRVNISCRCSPRMRISDTNTLGPLSLILTCAFTTPLTLVGANSEKPCKSTRVKRDMPSQLSESLKYNTPLLDTSPSSNSLLKAETASERSLNSATRLTLMGETSGTVAPPSSWMAYAPICPCTDRIPLSSSISASGLSVWAGQ